MTKKWILFLLIYTLSAFIFFVYCLFPTQALKKRIETSFAQNCQGEMEIRELSLSFPAGILMKGIDLNFPRRPTKKGPLSVKIDSIKAGLDFLKVIRGRMGVTLKAFLGEGSVLAEIDQKWIPPFVRTFSLDINAIPVEEIPILNQQFGFQLTGLLKGEAILKWQGREVTKGEGEWSFAIGKGKIIPVHFPQFSYDATTGSGSIGDETVRIRKIQVQGQDLILEAEGSVKIRQKIKESTFDTKVKLKPLPGFKQRLGGFASLLPAPDTDGFVNLFIKGPPGNLRFSSRRD